MPMYKVFVLVFISCNCIRKTSSVMDIPVGGIFEGSDQEQIIAFNAAVDLVNKKGLFHDRALKSVPVYIEPEFVIDGIRKAIVGINWSMPFVALEVACNMLNMGVVGIFTSLSDSSNDIVQSVCDTKDIPVIKAAPTKETSTECCSINVYPQLSMIYTAFSDLVHYWKWTNYAILYETFDIEAISEILKYSNSTGVATNLYQLQKNEHPVIGDILKQTQETGILMKKYNYIILNVDMHTIDLSSYQHSDTNIIGLQLVDPTDSVVISAAEEIQQTRKKLKMKTIPPHLAAWKLRTSAAILIDAVVILTDTLKEIGNFTVDQLPCNTTSNWKYGNTIVNYIKTRTIKGLTGLVQFDHKGIRNDFKLNIISLKEGGIIKIGTWTSKDKLQITHFNGQPEEEVSGSLRNKHLNIMISWSEPYVFYKNSTSTLLGNDQFEGFVIDLIYEISQLEGFNYTLIRNEDDKNGDYDPITKTWNGMIGDILSGRGDIAIGDIAVTSEREQVVDFTTPFMSLGIQILYLRPTKTQPVFFSFAHPFEIEVWLGIAVSYFSVSIGLYIMARLCQREWETWDRCIRHPKYLINQFQLNNSFWFVWGCFMQQGAEIAPRAASTRILSSFFAFFILVIVSFYKAQLAAFLTTEKLVLPFNNVEELVRRAEKLDSSYRNRLSTAILELQQKGVIDRLERKWWEEELGSKLCREPEPDPVAPPLTLRHMAGIFWITIIGVVLALILSFAEVAVYVAKRNNKNAADFFKAYKKEISVAFTLSKTEKTVKYLDDFEKTEDVCIL
ncbi:hypothetical protein FQA39_LY05317 [Lamprigera yunnana]|nr:hypothetical protein FQA39_LY05317 [Lamprigera yunnana]